MNWKANFWLVYLLSLWFQLSLKDIWYVMIPSNCQTFSVHEGEGELCSQGHLWEGCAFLFLPTPPKRLCVSDLHLHLIRKWKLMIQHTLHSKHVTVEGHLYIRGRNTRGWIPCWSYRCVENSNFFMHYTIGQCQGCTFSVARWGLHLSSLLVAHLWFVYNEIQPGMLLSS